ncbi:MAG: hypothetical protein ACLFNR_02440 [Candidatus Paceibacterota bacterium]
MSKYEVEIKSLLGKKSAADDLILKMESFDPNFKKVSQNSQLNHYFKESDIVYLYKKIEKYLTYEIAQKMRDIIKVGDKFSVRTRQKDSEVFLVIKASVDEGTSENTVSRLEFEEKMDLTLNELDALVLDSGYTYQAKWSRDRSEYIYKNMNVCIDRNAGYGYLVEFEKVVDNRDDIPKAKAEIELSMKELDLEKLPQDRLERMFEYYNNNWHQYYGTSRTFNIK